MFPNNIGFLALSSSCPSSIQEWGKQCFCVAASRHSKLDARGGIRWLVTSALHMWHWRSHWKGPVPAQETSWKITLGACHYVNSWTQLFLHEGLFMKVVPPGIKFKVNWCKYKLIWLLKVTQEWKIIVSLCFSPFLELCYLPYSMVLLWPTVRTGQKSSQDINTGGLPCTVLLCNFKYMLMDTNLWELLFNYILFFSPWNNMMWWLM